ncbi:MAG: efflux RND transporter periplasmic adaptor subunit, partial [Desulfobacterales bacterium]|nr:efflux RND transporter periplasmic adaptor subunit [Desulfobacterales bacterium]
METVKKYFGSKKSLLMVLAAVMVGVIIGYALRGDNPGSGQPEGNANHLSNLIQPADQEHAAQLQPAMQKEKTVYICPMNCVPPMEKAGRCPVCGMDLVAVAAQEHRHEEGPPRVSLTEAVVKAAGIQVAPVERRALAAEVRLFGRVEYDPAYQYKVTAFAPGVIDEIYVKRAGQTVKTGDALFDLYSVDLYFLEQELFAALEKLPGFLATRPAVGQRFTQWVQPWMWQAGGQRPKRRGRPGTSTVQPNKPEEENAISKEKEQAIVAEVARIRREIGSLGLTEAEVDRIITRGWPTGIRTEITPISGVVQKQDAFKSMYLNTGDSVFTIADPRYVWAMFDAFASDFPWIKLGQKAEFSSDAYPGEIFRGEVIYLEPYFDDKTRTFKVGVLCSAHQGKLKPGMLVRGTMYATLSPGYRVNARQSEEQKKMLAIPETAPLITGKRAVVYVEVAGKPGTYEGREVILGPRAKGYYVVGDGLQEGEKVVVNGNFKIDSAVQILAKPSMMEHAGGETMTMRHRQVETPAMDM